jgi:hypothetical protein
LRSGCGHEGLKVGAGDTAAGMFTGSSGP